MDDLQLAQEMYEDAIDATRDQRTQIEEDLRFSDPSDPQQWDEKVKRARETDPGGARPCLVMDHTGQYVANVAGQVTQNPPAIHTVPVGSGADIKVSEKIDGILRHVEYVSRAQVHYGIALTSAARTGVGYLIVRPEYTDRAMGYQEPRISSEADPLRVVRDPWDTTLDGSKGDFGYLLTSLSDREFERRFGKSAEKRSFGDSDRQRNRTDEDKSVIIAEQWLKCEEKRNVLVYVGADGEQTSGSEDEYWAACQSAGMKLQFVRNYADKVQYVKWRILSGAAILETPKDADGKEAYFPANEIGIVPVYGYWGVKDGRLTYCGIPRRAMNPQRAYNYHMSEQLAYMATAPRAPFVAGMRAMKGAGIQTMWERAAVDTRATLVYNDWDETTQQIVPAPQRQNVAVNLANHIQGAQQALQDIEAAIGMYRANLGAPSNETSGVAIDARKEQGEAATANFPHHLSAALGQVGRICLQMSAKLIDTRRSQRILGIDMKPGVVTVDPKQTEAVTQNDQGVSINPNVGGYDVRVVVGASYSTQRSQAQEALSTVMQANPALTPAIAPLWAQQLDFPHADKLAQVLIAMAPPAVQAVLNPDQQGKPSLEQVLQQNEQLQQGMQQAMQTLDGMQAELQKTSLQLQDKDEANEIARHKADTERLKVTGANAEQIQLIVQQMLMDMLGPQEPQEPQQMPQPLPMPPPMQGGPPPGMPMQPQPNPPSAGFSLPVN